MTTQVFVSVRVGNDVLVEPEKVSIVEAIARMQSAIADLRSRASPVFDASWGEENTPILAPSAEELHAFINRY